MQVEIRHLDIGSVTKVCFVLYAMLGVVIGIVYLVAALVLSSLMDYGDALENARLLRVAATGLGILLIPLLGLLYGCLGALIGLVFAAIYNLVSKTMGGIKLSLTGEVVGPETTWHVKNTEVRL
jgi:hypothetical protein